VNVLLLLLLRMKLLLILRMMRMMLTLLAVVSRPSVRPRLDLGPVVHETAQKEPPKKEVRALDHDDLCDTLEHGPLGTDDRYDTMTMDDDDG
jgi:hypothetical protein